MKDKTTRVLYNGHAIVIDGFIKRRGKTLLFRNSGDSIYWIIADTKSCKIQTELKRVADGPVFEGDCLQYCVPRNEYDGLRLVKRGEDECVTVKVCLSQRSKSVRGRRIDPELVGKMGRTDVPREILSIAATATHIERPDAKQADMIALAGNPAAEITVYCAKFTDFVDTIKRI